MCLRAHCKRDIPQGFEISVHCRKRAGRTQQSWRGAWRAREAGWKNHHSHGQRTGVEQSIRDQGHAFDTDKDLAPVILISLAPVALTVHKSLPVQNVQEYIDYARAHPGELSYGSSGVGSPHHLCAEYLASVTGVKLNHIPYKGSPDSAADVIAGHIPSAFTALGLVLEQEKAGNVRILAVTDDQRSSAFSDIPTIGETVPKFVHAPAGWNAMFVPAHTPEEIITTINKEMNVVLKDPDMIETMRKVFLFPLGGAPQDVTEKRHFEQDIMRSLADKIGLVPQ